MKLKKILALLLAIVLIVALAASCGGKTTPTATAPATSTETATATATATGDKGDGKVYDFIVQCWDPASSVCAMYVEVMGGIMNEKSNGRMTFTYYHGGSLVGAKDTWDAIRNGVCDMAWGACSPYAGVFPISEGVALPFNGVTCGRMGTSVIWDLYNSYEPLQKEYSAVKMVALGANTTAPLSLTGTKVPQTVADLKGLQIRVPNSVVGLWCTQLGMVPQTIAPPDTYESLEKNIVNGATSDWHFINAFSLPEVLKTIVDVPTCHSPLWLLVNKDKYESLPDDLKAIVDEMANGFAAEMMGEAWDYTRSWVIDQCAEKGIQVVKPSAELEKSMQDAATATFAEYKKYVSDKGGNGEEVFAKYQELINKYASQYADPWTNYESTFVAYKDKYYKGVSAK